MSKKLNALVKNELQQTFTGMPGGVLVEYAGIPSDETYALRKELHTKKIKLQMFKNSLASAALKECGVHGADLKGMLGICTSDDPVAVAKVLVEYKKKNKKTKLEIKGGILDKKMLSAKEVAQLAQLPGKQELRAQVVGTLAAPMRGLAMATAGILRKLLYGLNAVKEQKEKAGGAATPAA